MYRAEQETKAKLEKMQEIKKLNMQILQIRSEMSKNEDQLQDFKRYREFLTMLTPASWLEQHRKVLHPTMCFELSLIHELDRCRCHCYGWPQ